jgi:serine/threonine protein kinase
LAPGCPALEELAALVDGSSDDELVRSHVESCETCRARAADLRANEEFFAELLRAPPAAARPPAAETLPPPAVPGHEILGPIGRGGQGVVWRARQLATRREVALKVLLDGALASPERRRRFEREIDVVARLRHPGIVTIYDSGTAADGRLWCSMELVQGAPLDEYARSRERFALKDALRLFARVCDAVHYAHQRGVIHRDLKPGNVLVDEGGAPHVLDFGMAKALDPGAPEAEQSLSRSGTFLGTLAYAAPEQLLGDPAQIDVRTDVYALGAILFEMLSGERPHAGGGVPGRLARAIEEGSIEPPSARLARRRARGLPTPVPALDREVDVIALTALAKEKERRYPSAGELALDCERYLRGEPLYARRESSLYVLRKLLLRHKVEALAAAALLVVLFSATAVSTTFWRRSEDANARSRLQTTNLARINSLLERMLTAATPDRAKGEEVRARDVIDEASALLEREGGLAPEVSGPVHSTLGRAYRSLGLLEDASPHLERALVLSRARRERDAALEIDALCDLGELRFEQIRIDQASAFLEEARAAAQRAGSGRRLSRALKGLALAAYLRGGGEAEELTTRALSLLRAEADATPDELAELESDFGSFLTGRGRGAEAERHLRTALDEWRRSGDLERVRVAETFDLLGDVLLERDDARGAIDCFREALAIETKLRGADHLSVVAILGEIARAETKAEGAAAAKPRVEEFLRKLETHGEPQTLKGAAAHTNAGSVLADQNDFVAAEKHFRTALACYRRLGNDHPWAAACAAQIAWVVYQRGEVKEADELSAEALAIMERLRADETPSYARMIEYRAWIAGTAKRPGEAETCARRALAIYRRLLGEEHTDVANGLFTLGMELRGKGAAKEAEEHFRRALEMRVKLLGERHPDVLRCRFVLAQLLAQRGEREEAAESLRELLDVEREVFGEEHSDVASVMDQLGLLLLELGEKDEALELLEGALEMRRSLFGDESMWVMRSLLNELRWHNEAKDDAARARILAQMLALIEAREGAGAKEADPVRPELAATYRRLGRVEDAEKLEAGQRAGSQ